MSLIPDYKDIMALIKKGALSEAQKKIGELRKGITELQEENRSLMERIEVLENALNINSRIIWESPLTFSSVIIC